MLVNYRYKTKYIFPNYQLFKDKSYPTFYNYLSRLIVI